MVTFPFGYHSGYNLDFNCAESVNFALDSWIEIGRNAKSCSCTADSVVIDVSCLEASSSQHEDDISNKKRKRKFNQVEQDTAVSLYKSKCFKQSTMTNHVFFFGQKVYSLSKYIMYL